MAVQPRELVSAEPEARPGLELVPPPPPRPRVLPALAFVVILVAAVGSPALRSAIEGPPEALLWDSRPERAADITALDPIAPLPPNVRPQSHGPVGGIVFVSCTRLWSARPDGSGRRLLIDMQGLSSPVFSPNSRSLAFVRHGHELWLAGADGSDARMVGRLTEGGVAPDAYASGLAWSPFGSHLAFALVSPGQDPITGGASIWTLELATGEFERLETSVLPVPFFEGNKVGWAELRSGGFDLEVPEASMSRIRNFSSDGDDVALGQKPDWPFGHYWRGMAVIRETRSGEKQLVIRHTWRKRATLTTEAPNGYRFAPFTRPALLQDGSRVYVTLQDPGAGLDIGIFDVRSRSWSVRDYGWSPTASPAPIVSGKLDSRDADAAVRAFVDSFWGPGFRTELLLGEPLPAGLLPGHPGIVSDRPVRAGDGWRVPGLVFGVDDRVWSYRRIVMDVRKESGRIDLDVEATSPRTEIRDAAGAFGFVEEALDIEVPIPSFLPPDAVLQPRWPVSAYSYGRNTTAAVNFRIPGTKGGGGGAGYLTLSYGDDISFNMGCGSVNDPHETALLGEPAMQDRLSGIHQIIWPATPTDMGTATYSVHGDVGEATVRDVAESMATP